MFSKPEAEHEWLAQLAGNWSSESECSMGPDQPPMKNRGTMQGRLLGRLLGGLWLVGEMKGESGSADEPQHESILTLGYDPARQRFVGTFIAGMMTHLWVYEGQRDAGGKRLVLDTTGPRFDQSGLAKYQDIVEIVDQDHWILSSQILGDDGQWTPFMTGHFHRTGG